MSHVADYHFCICPSPANIVYVDPSGGCTNKIVFRTLQKALRYTDAHVPFTETVVVTLYPGTYSITPMIRLIRPLLVIRAFATGTVTIKGSFLVSDEYYLPDIASRVEFDGLSFTDSGSSVACEFLGPTASERLVLLTDTTFTTTTTPFHTTVVSLMTGESAGTVTKLFLDHVVITEAEGLLSAATPLVSTAPAMTDTDGPAGSLFITNSTISAHSLRPVVQATSPHQVNITASRVQSLIERQDGGEDFYVVSALFHRPNLITGCTIDVINSTILSRTQSGMLIRHEFEGANAPPVVNLSDTNLDVSYYYPFRAVGRFGSIRLDRVRAFGIDHNTTIRIDVTPPQLPDPLPGVFQTRLKDCDLSGGRRAIGMYDGVNGIMRRVALGASQDYGIDVRIGSLELEQVSVISNDSCFALDNAFLLSGNNCNLTSNRGSAVLLKNQAYATLRGGVITGRQGLLFTDTYTPTGFNRVELVTLNVRETVVKSLAENDVRVSLVGCTMAGFANIATNALKISKLTIRLDQQVSLFANLNTEGRVELV